MKYVTSPGRCDWCLEFSEILVREADGRDICPCCIDDRADRNEPFTRKEKMAASAIFSGVIAFWAGVFWLLFS